MIKYKYSRVGLSNASSNLQSKEQLEKALEQVPIKIWLGLNLVVCSCNNSKR